MTLFYISDTLVIRFTRAPMVGTDLLRRPILFGVSKRDRWRLRRLVPVAQDRPIHETPNPPSGGGLGVLKAGMKGPVIGCHGHGPAIAFGALGILLVVTALACSRPPILKVDGSSTVFPITEAMAEEFQAKFGEFRVTVGISGTGGGFKKFCNQEVQITNASRPIKPVEVEACAREGVEYIELPVAFDGLSVIVNPDNDWVDFLTVEELEEIWKPDSTVKRWSDVRPSWPDHRIVLAGADTDSGTFDYFTKAIMGEEGASRPDYTASADDNVLVEAIAREKYALGYMGFAYYTESADRLKLVPVGKMKPSEETISEGTYVPLSRPLFIYVNSQEVRRPEVREFVGFYLSESNSILVRDVGYVAFPREVYDLVQRRFEGGVTGSMFGGEGSRIGVSITDLLEEP